MRKGWNEATIMGNVGAEPDIRTLPSGDVVANFSIATTDSWNDKTTGAVVERTDWHRIVVYGAPAAKIVQPWIHKGTKVLVRGSLRTRKWTGQDNVDHTTTEIIVDMNGNIQLAGGNPNGSNQLLSASASADDSPPF